MQGMTLTGVYREKIFSPGKVSEDAAILDAALLQLSRQGHRVHALEAEGLVDLPSPASSCALIMAQSEQALGTLEGWNQAGTRIINSVAAVRNCYRNTLTHLLEEARLPFPAGEILPLDEVEKSISLRPSRPYWLKRGDVHAMQAADVVQVVSKSEIPAALDHFRDHMIAEVLVQEHVEGEVVKFYGVGTGYYFSAFLTGGVEVTREMRRLSAIACQAAEAVGLEVYGGDAIITRGGDVVLIDLNDWPSFSSCCEPAARGIAKYVTDILRGVFHGSSRLC